MYYVYTLHAKNQGWNNRSSPLGEIRTKERPKNAEIENVRFVKIALSFTSLIPCLKTPSEDRENSEGTLTQLPAYKKCFFLRLLSKKVVPLPKKVDSYPKTIDYFPKNFYSIPKNIYSLWRISCSSFIAFYIQQIQKNALFSKKVHFSLQTDKF